MSAANAQHYTPPKMQVIVALASVWSVNVEIVGLAVWMDKPFLANKWAGRWNAIGNQVSGSGVVYGLVNIVEFVCVATR